MKKILLLFILIITLSSCAAKVHVIEDSFYGQKFYQTDYISMSYWSATVKFRLRNISGTDDIILEAQYITDGSFNISEKNKIVLKFADNTFLNLYYTSSDAFGQDTQRLAGLSKTPPKAYSHLPSQQSRWHLCRMTADARMSPCLLSAGAAMPYQ